MLLHLFTCEMEKDLNKNLSLFFCSFYAVTVKVSLLFSHSSHFPLIFTLKLLLLHRKFATKIFLSTQEKQVIFQWNKNKSYKS